MNTMALTPVETDPIALTRRISDVTLTLLTRSKLIVPNPGTVFHAWPRGNRVLLVFDPLQVKDPALILRERFTDHLSKVLDGRPVLASDVGVYLHVGMEPRRFTTLASAVLNLAQQPTPLSVPFGKTERGPWWESIVDADSVLIAGPRRKGKTNFVHTWVMALVHGGACDLVLWDGKRGNEFRRYSPSPRVRLIDQHGLLAALRALEAELSDRMNRFNHFGVTKLIEYNRCTRPALRTVVLVIDELHSIASEPDGDEITALLTHLTEIGGAYGLHPVLATQRPDSSVVQGVLKGNLNTRISLAVPSVTDSLVTLGRPGAEKIANQLGRLAIVWDNQVCEAQAYLADAATGEPANRPDEPGEPRRTLEAIDPSPLPPVVPGADDALALRCLRENAGKFTEAWLTTIGHGPRSARRLQDAWRDAGRIVRDPKQGNAWIVASPVRRSVDRIESADRGTSTDEPANPANPANQSAG